MERLLWNVNRPYAFHPLLAFFLLLEKLPLAAYITTIAFGKHILPHCWYPEKIQTLSFCHLEPKPSSDTKQINQ
jgi:hypothetical protein